MSASVITHPEKVLFPDDGITKGDLAAYYEAMAPVILPHLRGRPITMERYPAGIGEKGFWQKDVSRGFPSWLRRLDAIEIPASPFTKAQGLPRVRAHWVRPEIVVQVAFIEWTVHGKLRHPRLLGVRFDKDARDVTRERP